MPLQKLKDFLDENGVKYVTLTHSRAFTAQEVAASAHISGHVMAKALVVKLDGKPAIVALPAVERLDLDAVRESSGARTAELATESEFASLFPGCELGAMPPFGNLFNLPVYVTSDLYDTDDIAFNAGTHTELVRMACADFDRLVKPQKIA